MTYQDWLALFDLPVTDPKVIAALAAHGVAPVRLGRDASSTGIDFKPAGLSVGFTSEFLLRDGDPKLPIVASVIMMLVLGKTAKGWTTYRGPLPYGLQPGDRRDDVEAKLGAPVQHDDDFVSARWTIDGTALPFGSAAGRAQVPAVDGLELRIAFTDGWTQIKQLGVSLPNGR